MAASVDPHQSLPELDLRVLARWRERDVAGEAERRRAGAPARVVWERPAAAVGPGRLEDVPGLVLADVFARYATMRGWDVERRGARDLHGLAVELDVERRLGLPCAAQAARDGVGELTARCRAAALAAAAERDALSGASGCRPRPPARPSSRATSSRCGGRSRRSPTRDCCTGPSRPSRTARAAPPRCAPARSRTAPSSRPPRTCASGSPATGARCRPATSSRSGPPRRGRSWRTPPSPSIPS